MIDNGKNTKAGQIVLAGNCRPARVAAPKQAEPGSQFILDLVGADGRIEYSKFANHCRDHCCPQKFTNAFLGELYRLVETFPAIAAVFPVTEKSAVVLTPHSWLGK